MKWKKLAIVLVLVLFIASLFTLTACGNRDEDNSNKKEYQIKKISKLVI